MHFEKDRMYHIFNQGNNRRKIFFKRENYLFFLKKVKVHILPYADVLAWCFLPNHFHLMVRVNCLELESGGATSSRTPTTNSTSLNKSIGIMLASYTRAINKQEKSTGSLFRDKTKAECLNCPEGISPSFYPENGVTSIVISDMEKEYPQVCFGYIHQNPVKAGLVKNETDWEYSSAIDYFGGRSGKLVNKKVAMELLNYSERDFESHPE